MGESWWPVMGCVGAAYIWWKASGFVDRGVEEEQGQFEAGQDYDPRRVRLATVHARQDIVGLYFLLSWVAGMLAVITGLIAAHVMHHW